MRVETEVFRELKVNKILSLATSLLIFYTISRIAGAGGVGGIGGNGGGGSLEGSDGGDGGNGGNNLKKKHTNNITLLCSVQMYE